MKKFIRFFYVSIFVSLLLATNSFGQTTDAEKKVDKDEINKTIWSFSSEADQRFLESHSRIEFNDDNTKETFFFSLNNKKIEKLIYEKIEGEMKASETYYFNKGKLVMSYLEELKKDRNDWQTIWSLSTTLNEDKVLDSVSNGKRDTEDEDSELKPIELSTKRLDILKERLKSINL